MNSIGWASPAGPAAFDLPHGRTGLWYSQAVQAADYGSELAHVGGTPWEELEHEDGLEMPPRPATRPTGIDVDRDPDTVPDPWELVPPATRRLVTP